MRVNLNWHVQCLQPVTTQKSRREYDVLPFQEVSHCGLGTKRQESEPG